MNRQTFLKTLGALILVPKALANIKPVPKVIHEEYKAGFYVTKEMINDAEYPVIYPGKVWQVDREAWFVLQNDIDNYFWTKRNS